MREEQKMKESKGITLIALVVTIVVLFILAGVTIVYTMGDNSVFQKAEESKFKQEVSSIKEQFELKKLSTNAQVKEELESEKIARINQAIRQSKIAMEGIRFWEEKMEEIHSMLQRVYKLVTDRILNATLVEADKMAMEAEIENIKQEIDNDAKQMGELKFSCVYGVEGEIFEVSIEDCSTNSLGENNTPLVLNIETIEEAQKSLEMAQGAVQKICDLRSLCGANQNRLEHSIAYLENIKEVLESRNASEELKNYNLAFAGIYTVQDSLQRVYYLAESAIGSTYSDPDRKNMTLEVIMLLEEIDRIANNTKNKNGISLLNGEWKSEFNITVKQLDIEGLNVDTIENAENSNAKVEKAMEQISQLNKVIEVEIEKAEIDFDIPEKWKDKLKIVNSELTYIGTDEKEKDWCSNIGIYAIEE